MKLSLHGKLGVFLVTVLILQVVGITAASAAPAAQFSAPGMPAPMYHVVRPGETLFSIGRLYGVSPWQIARTNWIPNPNLIFIGQVLVIVSGPGPMPPGPFLPGPSPIGSWPGGCMSLHTVSYGETLFSIGRLYGINPWAIARVNCLMNPNIIFAGQVLCLPAPEPVVVL